MLSQMDVPARQAYVMAIGAARGASAAASVTNVPRSLASAIGPLLPGHCSKPAHSRPLICGGALKIAYELDALRPLLPAAPGRGRS